MMKVIIIGGGASGLTAAITAAKGGAEVTIIEHENKPGAKLLMTGNGKCNVTNSKLEADKYYGDSDFIQALLDMYNWYDTVAFFNDMGLSLKDKNGYIYPDCEQALAVFNTLRDTALELGVLIKTNNEIKSISQKDDCFIIDIGIQLYCDKLIIATGGMSYPKTGSRGDGYKFAAKFGHNIIPPKPALTSIITESNPLFKAAGVRTHGIVSIFDNDGTPLIGDIGELQLTDYGISGIPVFNISHYAEKGRTAVIDFLPDFDLDITVELLKGLFNKRGFMSVSSALNGRFNDKLALVFLEKAGVNKSLSAKDITDGQIHKLALVITEYKLTIKAVRGFAYAQVTKGGVDTSEINPKTMESNLVKNLYFAGEIIDVDGICGGYNLQFAWATGTIAGKNCLQ